MSHKFRLIRLSVLTNGYMVDKKLFLIFTLILGTLFCVHAQTAREQWVDSVFATMDESQKLGQLFMMPVSSTAKEQDLNEVATRIKNQGIGGLLFIKGHPVKQASLTNQYQIISKIPLLVAQDASSGLGTQLDSAIHFPDPLAQGAIEADTLVYAMAKEIARELKLIGVNLNMAPAANLTHKNDFVYRFNSFGDNKIAVANKTLAYLKGMQSEGILACAKYFPIKGITITDVVDGLPKFYPYVDTVQAYPFQKLFDNGITAVTPATSDLPLFYETKKAARKNRFSGAALSTLYTGEWLVNKMKFNGLIMVDIDALQKVSKKKFKNGDAELFAFRAGNDLFITSDNPNAGIRKIKKLIKKDARYASQLNNSVRKILAAKYDAGLLKTPSLNLEYLLKELNTPALRELQKVLFEASVTVVKNENNSLPILSLENKSFMTIVAGETEKPNAFQRMITKYVPATHVTVNDESDAEKLGKIITDKNVIIAAFTSSATEPLVRKIVSVLKQRSPEQEVIIADFGCASIAGFTDDFQTVITGYTDQKEMFEALAQSIFGATAVSGKLSVTLGAVPSGFSIKTKASSRLQYSFPEDADMDSRTLKRIDAIAKEAISIGATPGCHVLIARKGKVIFEKSYGHLTYDKQNPVTDTTIYDLASVTKVTATLQAVMFMADRGLIDINKKASVYLPELRNTNKKDFTIKDMLTHQAGLWPFVPFWVYTMQDSTHLPQFYAKTPSLQYPYMVANKLYASSSIRDSLWHWTLNAKIREKPARTPYDYRYSDLGFLVMQRLAERVLNQPLEDFLEQNLYEPLGAYTTGYQPLLRFPVSRIAPTENDKLFRKTLLAGTVHDQGAAMHGGVAGHAGLFSTANDLAKLGQMLLQEGYYGGYQYYHPETVRLFTRKQFETSRRGLGWDKPVPGDWKTSPTSLFSSSATFGHTGFTGTCIWIDPHFDLVYIFLSNRVHPDMTNNKLLNANIRSRIQDVIYQSIFDYCKEGHEDLYPPLEPTGYLNGSLSKQ
jgi:beta-N-acetylhexosaminidase